MANTAGMLVLPMFLTRLVDHALDAQWLLYCPLLNFYIPMVAGHFTYGHMADVLPISGASFEVGATVLFVCAVSIIVLSMAFACTSVRLLHKETALKT